MGSGGDGGTARGAVVRRMTILSDTLADLAVVGATVAA